MSRKTRKRGRRRLLVIVVLLALIVLAASSVAGIINGLMVTRLNIVPFIATLVSQSLWRGCAYLLCDGRPIAISDAGLKSLGNGMVFGSVPYPVIMTCLLYTSPSPRA